MNSAEILKKRLKGENLGKILNLNNEKLNDFLAEKIEMLNPENIIVIDDSAEDAAKIRKMALETGEEKQLADETNTVHFDGKNDQARDPAHTRFLTEKPIDKNIKTLDRKEGLAEVQGILKNIMKNTTMIIRFFCLGPVDSEFSISAVQITDSPYVSHSEEILYRSGYGQFKNLKDKNKFFKFVHSEGEVTENLTSKNLDDRRIYIDLEDDTVYSSNTQYGGNTIGLKKLAMRLAIKYASKENWLCEHMFLMGIWGPDKKRKTYFAGAFPSACGKTSTSMIPWETIVGDDIIYIRNIKGKMRSVNVEKGMFGIIDGVNAEDDPILWDALHKPSEMIFSNVLIGEDKNPYWTGSGIEIPDKGVNFSGEWHKDKKDENDKSVPASHKNARFTLKLEKLSNLDENLDKADGVELGGLIYGGRDSDTTVPVEEAFDWNHGIIVKGACIESETTAATLGQMGVRKFNPMANMDFLSVSLGKYIDMNIKFGSALEKTPKIFSVNYFILDEDGNFMNGKLDKGVWLKWMELRVNGEADAVKTPTGYIPKLEDLQKLFKDVLNKDYSQDEYVKQFSFRADKWLEKIERLEKIYAEASDVPDVLFDRLKEQKARVEELKEKKGGVVSPLDLN